MREIMNDAWSQSLAFFGGEGGGILQYVLSGMY